MTNHTQLCTRCNKHPASYNFTTKNLCRGCTEADVQREYNATRARYLQPFTDLLNSIDTPTKQEHNENG